MNYFTCINCGVSFRSKKQNRKYCTNICFYTKRNDLSNETISCLKCGKSFSCKKYENRKYCSSTCSVSVNNSNRTRIKECLVCSVEITSSKNTCSRDCSNTFRLFTKYDDWFNGLISVNSSDGSLPRWARNVLLEQENTKCSSCGWDKPNPVTGKPILTVDHIDGNWKNNYCWNLRILCYNCHTLTPTFGSLNVGSVSGRRNYLFDR